MAQERYIDADALIKKLTTMHVPYVGITVPYTGGTLDQAINTVLQAAVPGAINTALIMFKDQLINAIQETATLKGTPCFLCKQRDCDELPAKVHI